MARLEKSRGANFYAKYLAKGEAHIAQAEPDRSDKLLIQLLSQDRPRIFAPSAQSNSTVERHAFQNQIGESSFPRARLCTRLISPAMIQSLDTRKHCALPSQWIWFLCTFQARCHACLIDILPCLRRYSSQQATAALLHPFRTADQPGTPGIPNVCKSASVNRSLRTTKATSPERVPLQ
jgi:hypothetical protein